jgi:hypothetical protein
VYPSTCDGQSNEDDASDLCCAAECISTEHNAAKIEDRAVQTLFPVACKAKKPDAEELRRLSFSTTEPQSEPEGELLNADLDSSSDDSSDEDHCESFIPVLKGSHSSIDLSVDSVDIGSELYVGRVYWLETTDHVQMHLSSLGDIHDVQNVQVKGATIDFEDKMGEDCGANGDDE